jgi:aryl-alcohol dehydrogenase-like predicted oxidoreductase
MRTRRIGQLEVSVTGLGCNNFGMRCDEEQTAAVVAAALDAGITFFDTADVYGGQGRSEELLGKSLQGHRDEVVIATKFGAPMGGDGDRQGASRRWIAAAVEDSLRRLGTDRIDLYQLHFPDQDTPIADTLDALDELVREGKVREIGCSNFSSAQLEEAGRTAADKGTARFVSVQNEYSLLNRRPEKNVLPACEASELAFLPYFPLAHGLLTGKYAQGTPPAEGTRLAGMPEERREQVMTEERLAVVDELKAFAGSRGHTVAELAFAWLLAHPPVASVIAGATRPEQVRANAAASAWELGSDDLEAVDRILG